MRGLCVGSWFFNGTVRGTDRQVVSCQDLSKTLVRTVVRTFRPSRRSHRKVSVTVTSSLVTSFNGLQCFDSPIGPVV